MCDVLNKLLTELKNKDITGYSFKSEDHYEMFFFCNALFANELNDWKIRSQITLNNGNGPDIIIYNTDQRTRYSYIFEWKFLRKSWQWKKKKK